MAIVIKKSLTSIHRTFHLLYKI